MFSTGIQGKCEVGKLLSNLNKRGQIPRGKPNQRIYAVGDVHGCLRETEKLLSQIKVHNDYRPPLKTYIVFLGDLIDRGPDSRGVIELLMDFPLSSIEPLFILGNHEEMMIRGLLGEPEILPDWLRYGGFACAESYGIPRSALDGQESQVIEHILRSAIPKTHVEFLSGFLESVRFGDYLFTHAGIRPGVLPERQVAREMRWIREGFLDYRGDHGFIVVHGHTITEEIDIRSNRIGLDTGAYKTGVLSAICIEEEHVSFLATA